MIVQTLIIAFIVSYIGSIPPGTLNITVMQLSIQRRHRAALFFCLAASMVEFVYAGITVQFHIFLNEHKSISDYFRVITSITLIGLGLWNLYSKSTSSSIKLDSKLTATHGFLRGLILGLLNPMSVPFWLAITTYLENDGLIEVTNFGFWSYLIGLTAGTFCLLITVDALGKRFSKITDNIVLVHKIPGMLLLFLGVYFLYKLVI